MKTESVDLRVTCYIWMLGGLVLIAMGGVYNDIFTLGIGGFFSLLGWAVYRYITRPKIGVR